MRNRLRGAFKVLTALAVSAAIWEILLRSFLIVPIPYQHQPLLGWMPRPFSRGLQTEEGRGVLRYNELGFRDGPLTKKAPDELRILAIGDSYTEGRQMNASQTFPVRLQTLLQQQLRGEGSTRAAQIRVLNGGRDGATPAYYVYLADVNKKLFEPDWVIVLVRDASWLQTFDRSKEIFYRASGDGFEIKRLWTWDSMSSSRRLLANSGVRDLALVLYSLRRWNLMTSPDLGDETKVSNSVAPDKLALTKHTMDWTLQQLRKKYPKLVLVHMPPSSPTLGGLLPPQPQEKMLITACKRYNIPLIPMRHEIMRDYQQSGQPPYGFSNTLPWTGHMNAHGHELVARALSQYFADQIQKQ
jgi:lysophospholipase L1-like esterase